MVYLINNTTKEIKQEFDGVIQWGLNFVEYRTRGTRAKIYCDTDIEHFTTEKPEEITTETTEEV